MYTFTYVCIYIYVCMYTCICICTIGNLYDFFHKWGCPQDGWFLLGKLPLKWMTWGYPYSRKPP